MGIHHRDTGSPGTVAGGPRLSLFKGHFQPRNCLAGPVISGAWLRTTLDALAGQSVGSADALAQCRRQVDELRQLTGRLRTRSATLNWPGRTRNGGSSVFLSSTYIDLKPHRDAVKQVIQRLNFDFVGMEDFAPSSAAPSSYIRQQVERAGMYFKILGMRYGYVNSGTGRSMTELEYEQALASGKQLLVFVMDKDAPYG